MELRNTLKGSLTGTHISYGVWLSLSYSWFNAEFILTFALMFVVFDAAEHFAL